jgi:hypothetical protein
MRFAKYSKNRDTVLIWYTPKQDLKSRIYATTAPGVPPGYGDIFTPLPEPPPSDPASAPPPLDLPHEEPPDPEDTVRKIVPQCYHDYFDVFLPTEVTKLPPHRPGFDMEIEIEEGKSPLFGSIYSLSKDERAETLHYIQRNLNNGAIRRSRSSAAAPILFAKKKDGRLRLCVDYRGLDSITKKNRYPLRLTADLLDRVNGCNKFAVIDLEDTFNLIRVKEDDEWKTAFRTHLGLFEHAIMPMGLSNAPATFQT